WRTVAASKPSHRGAGATGQQSGESADAMNAAAWRNCFRTRTAAAVLRSFPPLQKARIVQLACLEPIAKGLHITHWTSADLARQAVVDGILKTIDPASIRRILRDVDLQPHRTRYWKTAHLNDTFRERAEKIMWCYGKP